MRPLAYYEIGSECDGLRMLRVYQSSGCGHGGFRHSIAMTARAGCHKRGCLPSSSTSLPMPVVSQVDSSLDCPCLESPSDLAPCLPIALVVEEMADPIKHGRVNNLPQPMGQALGRDVVVIIIQQKEAGLSNRLVHAS